MQGASTSTQAAAGRDRDGAEVSSVQSGGTRPRLLDLYCGAGGAGYGYHLAGFEVVGVDVKPQPYYPFMCWRIDAIEALEAIIEKPQWFGHLDAIHASPPCQAFTVYGNNKAHVRDDHPDLVEPTRARLEKTGLPWVIENVPGAPLIDPITLCGTSFGIPVRRHRLFESNVELTSLPCDHERFTDRVYPGSSNRPNGRTVANIGEYRVPLEEQRRCMQIDWMPLAELSQAIPPVFTEHIGKQLLAHVRETVAA